MPDINAAFDAHPVIAGLAYIALTIAIAISAHWLAETLHPADERGISDDEIAELRVLENLKHGRPDA